jgi:acyl-CoA thioesterase FadM
MSLGELRESRIVMRFDYVRDAGGERELVARGEQEIGCLERTETGVRPVAVPDELRDALAPYGQAAVA